MVVCRHQKFLKEREGAPRRTLELLLREATTGTNVLPDRLPGARAYLRTELVQADEPCLRVHVHTAKPTIMPSHSAISSYNAISAGVHSSRYVEQPTHHMAQVLELMLRGSAALRTMLRNLDASGVHASLGTLLTKVEAAKDLPEAPQPAGFAPGIALHDYQRCESDSSAVPFARKHAHAAVLSSTGLRRCHSVVWAAPAAKQIRTAACISAASSLVHKHSSYAKLVAGVCAGRACSGCWTRSARRCATSCG